ncbi:MULTISPECIES: RNA polymerase sigma factor [unclassified Chitinophaga]|uniref:RNA polymerase sigma factor n=1 Tax=unclassified Chitinophaga TaxID=2619133 RepID=UPI0009D3A241|nr:MULTISPECIES: RNA polymerase sigma factor [unclassified Chitinophaga]OMP80999.1 hypothetical protein BW716_02400 [[Flexibacter] sp. ATCC 35208]WPV69977.1 RNA polymerase sigma factor [Chitinophaga sp. LS1]
MDNSTFSRIYNEYISMVYNLVLHYVSCHEDAQDITQDVFIKIYKNYQSHNPEIASLKTWIYRITVNQCLDFLRSRKAKKRLGFIISLVGNESAKPLNEAIHSVHPGIAAEDKDELQQLLSLVNKLPDKQKTALILARIEDKPQQEVAEIMNISVKAVESLLQRARQNLEKKLKKGEGSK